MHSDIIYVTLYSTHYCYVHTITNLWKYFLQLYVNTITFMNYCKLGKFQHYNIFVVIDSNENETHGKVLASFPGSPHARTKNQKERGDVV